jgi:putative ABC transport system permease protein
VLRIALRLLLDQPSKSLGTLLGVVVSAFLMAQQLSTFLGILGRVSAFVDTAGADIWIASPTTVDTDITESVPLRYQAVAMSTDGVVWASPLVQGMSRATRPDGVGELVKVVGVEGPRYLGLPQSHAGTLAGPNRVLISVADKPLYGDPVAGERLEVGGRTMIVAGFFTEVDPHGNYSYVFANASEVRGLLAMPEDRATFIVVRVHAGSDVPAVAQALRARMPEAKVFTRPELRAAVIGHFMARTPVGVVFGMGALVAALVGSLVVGVTMFSSVVDRTRDFATLMAVGATRQQLMKLLLAQALLFFAVGASVGLAIFLLVKLHATSAPMLAPWWLFVGVAASSLISCLLASVVAVRRVLAIDPAIVFKG